MPVVPGIHFVIQGSNSRQECTKEEKTTWCVFFSFVVFICGIGVIRIFTEVVPNQYYWPCNNTDILPSMKIRTKQQDCIWQKCAKINIQNNLEEIKEKALTISIWLFRIAAVLLLLCGILCYHERKLIRREFGIFVFTIVAPIFFNAFFSLYDYFAMPKFTVNC